MYFHHFSNLWMCDDELDLLDGALVVPVGRELLVEVDREVLLRLPQEVLLELEGPGVALVTLGNNVVLIYSAIKLQLAGRKEECTINII